MQNSKKWSIIGLLSVIALSLTYMLSTGQMSFSGLSSDVLSPNFICTESSLAGETNKYNANIKQYKTISAEVQVLTASITTLNTEIKTLATNKANLEAENVSYSAEVKTLQSFIATNCNPPRPNQVAQCNQKKNKVTTLKAKITNNQTKIADLKNKITNKTNQVAIKQAQKDAKLAKLLQLSPKIAAYETCRLELTGKPTVASNVSGELKITSGEVSVSGEVNCKTKIVSGEAVFISGEVKAPNISGEVMNASGEVKIKTILQVNVDSMIFLVKPTPENNLQIKEWFLAMGEGKNETRTNCTSSQSSSVPVEIKVTCTTPKPYVSANVIAPGAKTPFKLIGRLGSIDAPLTVKTQFRELKYNGGRTDIYDMTKEAVLTYTAGPIKLFSVEIDPAKKTADVNYCKNFDTCAHMYESGNVIDVINKNNFFCPKTGPIKDIPLADLPLLKEGMKVRLKHGNESIWSNDVVVTSKKKEITTATAVSNAAGTIATITNPGFGYPSYTSSPIVTVTGGTCTKLPTATARASLGVVNSVILTGAVNCTVAPIITIASPIPVKVVLDQPTLVPAESTTSRYITAGSENTKARYKFTSSGGTTVIRELYFVLGDSVNNPVRSIQIGDIVAPVVDGSAVLRGLQVAVPEGESGIFIDAIFSYNDVGVGNPYSSGVISFSRLFRVGYSYNNPLSNIIETTILETSLSTPPITLVGGKPYINIMSNTSSRLAIGRLKIGEVIISAPKEGDININDITFNMIVKNITNFALSNQQIRDSNNNLIDAVCENYNSSNSGGVTCAFGTTSNNDYDGYNIPAESAKTFTLYADVTGTMSSNYDSSISTSLDANGFNWYDMDTDRKNGLTFSGALLYNFPTGSYTVKQ